MSNAPTLKQIETPAGLLTLTCLFCKHFYFSGGTQGYSEMTPGGNVDIGCNMGEWDYGLEDDAVNLRRYMLTAQDCDMYELEVRQ